MYYFIQLYLFCPSEINFTRRILFIWTEETSYGKWTDGVGGRDERLKLSLFTRNSPFLSLSTWQPEDKVIKRKAHYKESLSCMRTLQGLVQLKESFLLTMKLWYSIVEMSMNKDTIKVRERKKGNDSVSLIFETQSHCLVKLNCWELHHEHN